MCGINAKFKKFATDEKGKINFNKAYEYVETLLCEFSVLTVTTSKYEEIYQMFELINNRGVKLSPADQVKAYLMSEVEKRTSNKTRIGQYEKKWRDVANNVTNKTGANYSLEKFLLHYLIINNFNRPTSVPKRIDLYPKFRVLVEGAKDVDPTHLEDIIEEMLKRSETFEKIRLADGEHFKTPSIIHYLKKLKKIRAVNAYPVILGAYQKFWRNDCESFDSLVSLCCKYHLRRRIMASGNQIDNKEYERKLHGILKQILERKKLENIIDDTLIAKYPSDDDLKPKLKIMHLTDHDFAIAILEEAEYHGVDKCSRDDTVLEHIMPETIDRWENDILEHKPEADKDEDYIKEFHEEHLNTLGNLTLLSKENNSAASNKTFDEKLIIYQNEPTYKITTMLVGKKQWDGNEIKKRRDCLTKDILAEIDIIKIRKRLESRRS